MQTTQNLKNLYEQDFVAWCEATIAQLKSRQLDQLDIENLMEEIDGLSKRDRRELKSRLIVLLAHLLKRLYVNSPENFIGWELTIREQRRQIQALLTDSPSLKPYLWDIFRAAYVNAKADVELEYSQTEFPTDWPLDREQLESVLTDNLWDKP